MRVGLGNDGGMGLAMLEGARRLAEARELAEAASRDAGEGAGAGGRCCTPLASCRRLVSQLCRGFDRLALRALRHGWPSERMTAGAEREALRLRCGTLFFAILSAVAFGLLLFCGVKGTVLLAKGTPPACQQLRLWLCCYVVTLGMLPFLFAIAAPLVIWWAVNGRIIREKLPWDARTQCHHSAPVLWVFVDEVFVLSLAASASIIVLVVLGWFIKRRLYQIHSRWGGYDSNIEVVVSAILGGPPHAAAPGSECTICLDDVDTETRWRALRCGHAFHEHCLLEWLQHARRCPLCRLDLHAAYAEDIAAAGSTDLEARPG